MKKIKKGFKNIRNNLKKDKKFRAGVIGVFIFVVLVALLYFAKNYFIVATVDGYPITRYTVIKQLESQAGKQVVENLVTKQLIINEASNKGISVTKEDVDAEIASISEEMDKQGVSLEETLELQGQSMDDLMENIRIQKLVENLISGDIEVTEEAIQTYYEENKEFLGEDVSLAEVSGQIKEQLMQQELSSKYQEWIAGLTENSNVKYFIVY